MKENKAIRLHITNLDQLYVGREFSNFGEMCIFLGIGKPKSNNGKSVINRKNKIAKYFEFERIYCEETGRLLHRIRITKLLYDPNTIYADDSKVEADVE